MYEEEPSPDRLFALSELSFSHALDADDRAYFLAAAVYAYAYLLPDHPQARPEPTDPRLRLAVDLYNRGLTRGLQSADESEVVLKPGLYELPFGTLGIKVDRSGFAWGDLVLTRFVSVADLQIRGLRNRHRRPGIGIPLAARSTRTDGRGNSSESSRWLSQDATVAVTAFLRIDDVYDALLTGEVTAQLEVYAADRYDTVEIDGESVPLELDVSAALAYSIADSALWDFELAGFRLGDLGPSSTRESGRGLLMIAPYQPGRVPVVFVHGTASSPLRWANMTNDLINDSLLRGRLQPWYFIYNSGNPLALSASRLRQALQSVVTKLDPDGNDPALRRMVVIGHSQGGLLTKMMVIDSGDRFWDLVSSVPLDRLEVQDETREILEEALFFEALPFVSRVVFIATPHRGSFAAERRLVGLANRLVRFPSRVVEMGDDLVDALRRDPEAAAERSLPRVPTSVENMRASNPLLQTLVATPIADGVKAHSIIAVTGDGPVEESDDGVVAFESAYLEGVESVAVVRSGHSAQQHPDTVAEVRRILLLQLDDESDN